MPEGYTRDEMKSPFTIPEVQSCAATVWEEFQDGTAATCLETSKQGEGECNCPVCCAMRKKNITDALLSRMLTKAQELEKVMNVIEETGVVPSNKRYPTTRPGSKKRKKQERAYKRRTSGGNPIGCNLPSRKYICE